MGFLKQFVTKDQVASFVRSALKAVGGYVGVEGYFSADEWSIVVGAGAVIAGVVWSALVHKPSEA